MKKILTLFLIFTSTLLLSQNDCSDALIACGNSGYQDLNVTGIGTQELNNSNTCASEETNSIWFKLIINTGGTLGFTLTPNSTSINEDFDFFIFGPTATCGNIGQAIRCSTTNPSAASQGNNLTGMNSVETDTAEGPGQLGNSFVQWLNVSDGDTYFLVIDRPIGVSNFSINWIGTATFSKQPTFENPTANVLNIEQCDTDMVLDEISEFDLTVNTNIAIGSQNNVFASYHTSNNDAVLGTNSILQATTFENTSNPEIIYLRLTNTITECFDVTEFTITVKPIITLGTPENLKGCNINNDGFYTFNLSQNDVNINPDIVNNEVSYFDNEIDAINNNLATKLPVNYTNSIAYNSEIVWVRVESLITGCFAVTNFNIEVFELPTITTPVSLKQCDNDTDGFSPFNLTEVNDKISTNASNEAFTYFYSYLGAASNDTNDEILNSTAYTNQTASTETLWARIENNNGCHRVAEINLIVSTTSIPSSFQQREFYECDDYLDAVNNDTDGVSTFNFSTVTADVITELNAPGQQLTINYYRNEADAFAEENSILDPSNYRNVGYTSPQIIYIRIDSELDNDCLGIWPRITLNVEPLPIANTITINRECDDDFDGFFPFDISLVEATVLNGQTNVTVSYFNQNNTPLPSPLPNPFLTNSQTITIRVTNNSTNVINGACFDETNLEFIVDQKPVANSVSDQIECDDDLDGLFPFDTSTIETTLLNGQNGMLVSYVDENGDSLTSPLPNPFLTAAQTITIKVENELNSNCTAETTFNFIVNPKPEFELDETAIYCTNLPPIDVVTSNPLGNYTYEWKDKTGTTVSVKPNIITSSAGIYTVIATSNEGCESFPHQIIIEASSIALLTENDITLVDDSDNNSITIATTNLGIGDYEYALAKLDGFVSSFQDEPYFDHLAAGIYTVLIQDKNNCGITQLDVSIVGFPKFFTPNNDGFNDTWNILGVNDKFYMSSVVNIFDRFGKFITQINREGNGWDGLFKGNPLPATDYWFSVELVDNIGNIRTRKGHFSLIRR